MSSRLPTVFIGCLIIVLVVLASAALAAQSRTADRSAGPSTAEAAGLEPVCYGRQNQPVAFLDVSLRDTLDIKVDSDLCAGAQAVITLAARDGRLLVTQSVPLGALSHNGEPTPETLHPILADFISNVSGGDASEIPPNTQIVPLSREILERARLDGGAVLCFPVDTGMLHCLWHDNQADETLTLFTMAY